MRAAALVRLARRGIPRHWRAAVLVAACQAMLLTSSADAQEFDVVGADLEGLMRMGMDTATGASRYLQKISESPTSITVVTRDEISAYGYRTFGEVLAGVRGFYVTDDRNYTYFGTRGLAVPGDYNSRMLVLVDGHRINDNVYDSVLAGTEFPIDIGLIDRIEVIRGPASAMYGANAFSAVINVITRSGAKLDGLEIAGDAGSLATRRGRASYGKRYVSGLELALSGSRYLSRGDTQLYFPAFDAPATNNGIVVDADRDRSHSLFGSVSYGDFTVRAAHGSRRKQVPTASYATTFNDPREQTIDSRGFFEAQFGREIGLTSDVLVRGYYDRYRYRGYYPFVDEEQNDEVEVDSAEGDAVGAEVTVSRRVGARQRWVIQSEYRRNLRQDLFAVIGDDESWAGRHRSTAAAASLQYEARLPHRLTAGGALRYNHQSDLARRVTPRASLVAGPYRNTYVKALFADAFRAPSAAERYDESSLWVKSNPELQPEKIRSLEVAIDHHVKSVAIMTVSLYRTYLNGVIVPGEVDGGMQLVNGHAVAEGVEVGAQARTHSGISAAASYAFQRPQDQESRNALHDAPAHLLKVQSIAPVIRGRFRAAVQIQYSGDVLLHTGERLAPAWTTNASFTTAAPIRHTEFGVTLSNVFDARNGYPVSAEHVQGSVPQYGRRLSAGLTWHF